MARLIAGIAEESKLTPRPIIVVNKSGGAGAEGFLHVKGKKGDDKLKGNQGRDNLNGGKGTDSGNGGPGKDKCRKIEHKKSC